jgi:hypothetical protein
MSETMYHPLTARESTIGPAIKKMKPDRLILTCMAHQLALTLHQFDVAMFPSLATVSWITSLEDCQKPTHRIAVYLLQELRVPPRLSCVGFVSGRRANEVTPQKESDALLRRLSAHATVITSGYNYTMGLCQQD